MNDEARLREAIIAAGRRLGARGLISAGEGNLSVRVDDVLLMTASGRRKDELAPEDVLVAPLVRPRDERFTDDQPRPSSDIAIHRAAYAARPDVLAVVHAHLPAAMALTLAGEIPNPQALPETAHFIPVLPYLPFKAMGSQEMADDVAAALTTGPAPLPGAVLLEIHGAVAVGRDLDVAVNRLELVEVLCRTWRDALLVRAAQRTLASQQG